MVLHGHRLGMHHNYFRSESVLIRVRSRVGFFSKSLLLVTRTSIRDRAIYLKSSYRQRMSLLKRAIYLSFNVTILSTTQSMVTIQNLVTIFAS